MYRPLWSENCIKEIEKILTKDMIVYEWGTGYSTLWLADRVKRVITMDHDPEWTDRIKTIAEKNGISNIEFQCHPLESIKYFEHILDTELIFGFIIVDGRERVRCFNNACQALSLDGVVLLDDSERERYAPAFEMGLVTIKTIPPDSGDQNYQYATLFAR